MVLAVLLVSAAQLSAVVRAWLATIPSFDGGALAVIVTAHAVVFVFAAVPTALITLCWLLRPWTHNHLPSLNRVCFLLVGLVVSILCVYNIGSGWTFYPALLVTLEDSTKTESVVAAVVAMTAVFWGVAVDRLSMRGGRQSHTTDTLVVGLAYATVVLPILLGTLGALLADRIIGTSVFDYPTGSPVAYETLFWVFGHPEVYLLILPFVGVAFSIKTVFFAQSTRKARTPSTAAAILRVVILSFWVWGHHMLSVNFAPIAKAFFVLASLCITIPMFRVILAAAVSVRRGGSVRVTGSPRAPVVVVSLIGFLLGGLCSFFFFFPRLAGLSLGTRVVVAHFHLFFIVFWSGVLIVFAYIFINGIQNHLSRSWCFGLLLPTVVAGLFFLVSVAAGFAGAARRVPSVLLQTDFNSVFFSTAVGVCTVPVVVILLRSLSCGLRSA